MHGRILIIVGVSGLLLLSVFLVMFESSLKPPVPTFPTVKSNSWIVDPVILHHFVPFGEALIRLQDGRLVIDRGRGWTASNFVAFGMLTDGNNTLFFHPSINMGGSHGVRLVFNGRNIYSFLPGDPYYDDGGRFFPYPTVYTNPKNRIVTAFAYDEETRRWFVKILDTGTSPPTEILYVEGVGRLSPLWIGRPEGPFVVHGVAGVRDGWLFLDAWGGFLDFAELLEARYRDPETGIAYNFTEGFFFFDREYHRLLPIGRVRVENGKIVDGVEFNAMSLHKIDGERVELIFIMARNPLPEDLKRKIKFPEFERFGRISFADRGESYRLDDYVFWTDGKLQPDLYYLKGNITDEDGRVVGEVDLSAQAFGFWGRGGTENWHVGRPWWDPNGRVAWGRSFVKWRGTITLRNETITVKEAPGFGEFMRYDGAYMPRLIWAQGTVRYIPLEGGFYGIITDEGDRLLPLNLPAEFRMDGLRVKFKARLRSDVATIQMWGRPVEILWIEEAAAGEAEGKVSQRKTLLGVKVAILYATIIDQMRSTGEINRIIKDLNADLLFRGFFRWRGMAEAERKYDVYGILKEYLSEIKEENPDLIFVGALAAQEINRVEYDPFTRQIIPEEKVWEMALDPQKYGFNISKEELHRKYWSLTQNEDYIFPDILNPEFQELLLDYAKVQIDAGADAIWIDGLFWQAGIFARLANNVSHPSIEMVFEAINKIVDEIHRYGSSKGRVIYVGSWAQTGYPYPAPKLDFVTISPSPEEVKMKRIDEDKWIEKIREVREKYGDVLIIAFIDWAFTADTPLGVFSQTLTIEEQREALARFEAFFTENGIAFAYPVHGGYMGRDAVRLAFGRYHKYDALAPEFQTYETIKELAQKRVE